MSLIIQFENDNKIAMCLIIYRSPIMQGNTEQQQLTLISQLCGSISPDVWPGVDKLDLYNKMELLLGQKRKVSKVYWEFFSPFWNSK